MITIIIKSYSNTSTTTTYKAIVMALKTVVFFNKALKNHHKAYYIKLGFKSMSCSAVIGLLK